MTNKIITKQEILNEMDAITERLTKLRKSVMDMNDDSRIENIERMIEKIVTYPYFHYQQPNYITSPSKYYVMGHSVDSTSNIVKSFGNKDEA